MRWQFLGAGLLVVVGVGAAAFAVVGPDLGGTAATQYLTSQATVADVVEEVTATGTIEAATTYALAFGSAPTEVTSTSTGTTGQSAAATSSTWVVETVTAVSGQAVNAGDVLATADASDAELDLAIAEANLASAEARLAADKKGLTGTEKTAAKLQVTQAKQSLSQARSSYANTVAQNN
jgi:HlyD family secretion protein